MCLEEHELLFDRSENLVGLDLENVESDSLRKRSALSDGDNISFVNSLEGRGAVSRDVRVSLLVSAILLDIVEIISSDDDGSVHFGADAHSLEDTSSDGDIAGEGTLLVDVGGLYGVGGGVEAQTNLLEVSGRVHSLRHFGNSGVVSLAGDLRSGLLHSVKEVLVVGVDTVLFLVSFVSLNISHLI